MSKAVKVRSVSERFHKLLQFFMTVAEFVGANVVKDNYRMNWVTYTVIFFIICYFSFTSYTVFVSVVLEGDWSVTLQCMCMVGSGIQGTAKLTNALVNGKRVRVILDKIEFVYKNFEHVNDKYRDILLHSLALAKRIIFSLFLIYGCLSIGLICVPLFYSIFLNRRVFILEFYLPKIEQNTDTGYFMHQVVQATCVLFGCFGNFASDTMLFVVVSQIPLFKNVIKNKFDELDDVLTMHPRNATKSGPLLMDIFKWHQEYMIVSEMSKNAFFWVIFVQIGTAALSIICTIVCQFLGVLPSGPVYLIYSFVILYCYCGLGNLVEIANDDVTTDIYDCMWYELPVPEQKMLLIMLRQSQKCEGMSIGGVSPLTMNAGLQLTKSIYTISMILNEFFD